MAPTATGGLPRLILMTAISLAIRTFRAPAALALASLLLGLPALPLLAARLTGEEARACCRANKKCCCGDRHSHASSGPGLRAPAQCDRACPARALQARSAPDLAAPAWSGIVASPQNSPFSFRPEPATATHRYLRVCFERPPPATT